MKQSREMDAIRTGVGFAAPASGGRPSTSLADGNARRAPLPGCRKAGVPAETSDGEGLPPGRVDVHSLWRACATRPIGNGAYSKGVQDLPGHKTLAVMMSPLAKMRPQNKRQAVARPSYREGVTAPAHLIA